MKDNLLADGLWCISSNKHCDRKRDDSYKKEAFIDVLCVCDESVKRWLFKDSERRIVKYPYPRLYSFTPIDDVKTKSSIRHSFHFASRKNEDKKREIERKGKVKKRENRDKEILRSPSASYGFLDFLKLIPIVSIVSPFCPSILTFLLPCCVFTAFFFAPEGNTEHLLREKKRLSGADARPRCNRCIERRNDNSSHRTLAFLIYWLLAHAIRLVI